MTEMPGVNYREPPFFRGDALNLHKNMDGGRYSGRVELIKSKKKAKILTKSISILKTSCGLSWSSVLLELFSEGSIPNSFCPKVFLVLCDSNPKIKHENPAET